MTMKIISTPWQRRKRELTRRLTFMVVPHGTGRPRQMTFSIPFVAFLLIAWTGLTGWASYLASRHFDYWRMEAHGQMMRIKLAYLASELSRFRSQVDQVKEADSQLRSLINMGSREAIIQSDGNLLSPNQGGPTPQDAKDLDILLQNRLGDLTMQDISRQLSLLKSETSMQLRSYQEISRNIESERALYRTTPNVWPLNGYITSHFGGRLSPFSGQAEMHRGMDIAAPAGTPVRATADGTVYVAGWSGGYGNLVVIDHGRGYSTRYGHNRQLLVKAGDKVKRGQTISLVGSTGSATGPHCHYEVWHDGHYVNPRKFMKQDS